MVPQGHNILKVILPYFCGRQIFEDDFFFKIVKGIFGFNLSIGRAVLEAIFQTCIAHWPFKFKALL
jgi:hypothetical protein